MQYRYSSIQVTYNYLRVVVEFGETFPHGDHLCVYV